MTKITDAPAPMSAESMDLWDIFRDTPFITPYIAWERVRQCLQKRFITIKSIVFEKQDEGTVKIPLQPRWITAMPDACIPMLTFKYKKNESGMFDITATVDYETKQVKESVEGYSYAKKFLSERMNINT